MRTYADCHIHMLMDGENYKAAVARHKAAPDEAWIRAVFAHYQQLGFSYLRDGGDRWGVGVLARTIAPEYGITYRIPVFPMHKAGHYGHIVGKTYGNFPEFRRLLAEVQANHGDFVKLMISGLMDFNEFGTLTEPSMDGAEIAELIHICHEEGLSVMAHTNGSEAALAAAEAGVDSIEHGAYLNAEALTAMAEHRVVWVPTLATIGNLRRSDRFPLDAVGKILASAQENVRKFHAMGGILAPGSDAGAFMVPHGEGSLDEYQLLQEALGPDTDAILKVGIEEIQRRF